MNENILKGRWKQLRGEMKSWWGKLTSDDFDQFEGSLEKLSGILQERYGFSMQEAQLEIADFLEQIEKKLDTQPNK